MKTTFTKSISNIKEKLPINNYQVETLLENVPRLIYLKDLNGDFIVGTKPAKQFIKTGIDVLHNVEFDMKQFKKIASEEDKFVKENNKVISKENILYDTNGMPHYYSVYKAPVNDFDNNIIGIIVILKNIDKAKMLDAQKETFVASLGHDLKNPTISQIRALELLLNGTFGEISKEQREVLEMILDSCRYMNGMLASLLATYRNEQGIIKLHYEGFSFTDLVDECVSEMVYVAKDKNVDIRTESTCELKETFGDKVQIKRVIMNLLSNGIKYAEKNSSIVIRTFNNKDNGMCFEFENSSPYISPEKRKAIFAQYVSFAGAHKELGIGLGLYTSKKIIEAHDGNIFVESFKDNRNIFGFTIPNACNSVQNSKSIVL